MTLLERLVRAFRTGARRAGLVRDRTSAAAAAVEALIDERARALLDETGVPGLAVVVRFPEGRTVRRGVGSAGTARAMSAHTVFPVASLSKAVSTFCAMTLVEDGLVSLDEPVERRIRSWRMPKEHRGGASPEAFTLRRLLSHSAGFDEVRCPRVPGTRSPLAAEYLAECERDDRALRVVVPPGSRFRYSGPGYTLAQLFLEDVTGTRFADLARERVLRPLGMESSDYDLLPELESRRVTGHDRPGEPLPFWISPTAMQAGLFTTAEDLAVYWNSLVPGANGEPAGRGALSPALCAEMLKIQVPHPHGDGWGLGFRLRAQGSEIRYQHGGRGGGCFGQVQGFVHRRVAIAVLANADWALDCGMAMCREIRHLLDRYAL